MSYLYIPDGNLDDLADKDDPALHDGYLFWGTWFNPKTGAFFHTAGIDGGLVRVSGILVIPEDQRAALLKEIVEDEEESPLWASFVDTLDACFVEEWEARLARFQAEQGAKRVPNSARPRCGHCGSLDTRPDRNEGWQVCNKCRYTTRTDAPFLPPVQRLLRQIAAEVDAESVGLREWECDHDTAQNLGRIVAELADLARDFGWGSLGEDIRRTSTSITWTPEVEEESG